MADDSGSDTQFRFVLRNRRPIFQPRDKKTNNIKRKKPTRPKKSSVSEPPPALATTPQSLRAALLTPLLSNDTPEHSSHISNRIDAADYAYPQLRERLRQYLHPVNTHQGLKDRLSVTGLSPDIFQQLYKGLKAQLEQARVQIDYDADARVWIIAGRTRADETGAAGWAEMVGILKTMDMPEKARRGMIWVGGQPDIPLLDSSGTASSMKSPDASLGWAPLNNPTIVLETAISESMSKLRLDARRLLQGGCEPDTDTGIQCVIIVCIHSIAEQIVEGESAASIAINAMTIEIWRNARRDKAEDYKLLLTEFDKGGSAGMQTKPVLVSRYVYTATQIEEEFLPAFKDRIQELATESVKPEHAAQAHANDPPVPRNPPLADAQDSEGNDKAPSPPHPPTNDLPYFTIYLEDLISQSHVPPDLRNSVYVNIPYRVFLDGYIKGHLQHAPAPVDNANVEQTLTSMDFSRFKRQRETAEGAKDDFEQVKREVEQQVQVQGNEEIDGKVPVKRRKLDGI